MVTSDQERLRILMVDDDNLKLDSYAAAAKLNGGQVRTFLRPAEALEEYREHPDSYDVVFTDYNMPEIDGAVFAQRIRQSSATVPIVMMSVRTFSDDQQELLRGKGIDLFLRQERGGLKQTLEEVKQLIQQRRTPLVQ